MLAIRNLQHDYASTQINLTGELRDRVLDFAQSIDDEDFIENGYEDNPHITLKYGLHAQDPAEVEKVLFGEPPIHYMLGEISLFELDDCDVVKIEVISDDLHRLNEKVSRSVEHTDTFPEYVPHVTIAYLQPGKGRQYVGNTTFAGYTGVANDVVFSTKDDEITKISLGYEVSPKEQLAEMIAADAFPTDYSGLALPNLDSVAIADLFGLSRADVDLALGELAFLDVLGGKGSGNFGHEGRPGQVGGSGRGNDEREELTTVVRAFNFQNSMERRFLFNPQTGKMVLGFEHPKNDPEFTAQRELYKTHAEEFRDAKVNYGIEGSYDEHVRGWIHGPSEDYPHGMVEVYPVRAQYFPGGKDDPVSVAYNAQISLFEFLKKSGATGDTEVSFFDHGGLFSGAPTLKENVPFLFKARKRAAGGTATPWAAIHANADKQQPAFQKAISKAFRKAQQEITVSEIKALLAKAGLRSAGGKGSGNFGHSGRPGEVGGSGDSKPKQEWEAQVMRQPFDLKEIMGFRRFLYNPKTNELVLGETQHFGNFKGELPVDHSAKATGEDYDWLNDLQEKTHGEAFANAGLPARLYDSFSLRGYLEGGYGTWEHSTGKITIATFPDDPVQQSDDIAAFLEKAVHLGGGIADTPLVVGYSKNTTLGQEAPSLFRKKRVTSPDDVRAAGGPGSGNFGHGGRPGEVGGSSPMHHATSVAFAKKIKKEGLKAGYAADSPLGSVYYGLNFHSGKQFAIVVLKPESRKYLTHEEDGIFRLDKGASVPPEYIKEVQIYNRLQFKDELDDNGEWNGTEMPKPFKVLEAGDVYVFVPISDEELRDLGGPGSGNFDHAGRPGEVGGSAPTGEIGSFTAGGDRLSLEESRAVMKEYQQRYKTDADYKGAADVLKRYSESTQQNGLYTRYVVEQALAGRTPDEIEADPKYQKLLADVNNNYNEFYQWGRKHLDEVHAGAAGYYKMVRNVEPTKDVVYRGMKGGSKKDEFELRGPTAFSHDLDVAMSYSGGTLIKVLPGSKMLPTQLLAHSRNEDPHGTVPAFYKRTSQEIHPLGSSHGYAIDFDSDRELNTAGRFRVVDRSEERISFTDAKSGKFRLKTVKVLTVEQIGVF